MFLERRDKKGRNYSLAIVISEDRSYRVVCKTLHPLDSNQNRLSYDKSKGSLTHVELTSRL
jgi:hypothetical protein